MSNIRKKLTGILLTLVMMFTILPNTGNIKAQNEDFDTAWIIHYHKNDGSQEVIDKTYADTTAVMEDTTLFRSDGKIYIGWSTQPDGTGEFYDVSAEVRNALQDKQEVDVYAIWEETGYSVIFKDMRQTEEYEYKKMRSTEGAVVLPEMPTHENNDESFSGWRSSVDNKLYQPQASVPIKCETVFTAVWERSDTKKEKTKEKKDLFTSVVYNRMKDSKDRTELVMKENINTALSYPEQFIEKDAPGRKFLYWSLSPYKYVDDMIPDIKPGDDLTEYYDGSNTLQLYAIYENESLDLSYVCPNLSEEALGHQRVKYTVHNGDLDDPFITLHNIDIKDFSDLQLDDTIYEWWSLANQHIEPGHYQKLNIITTDRLNILDILIDGSIVLNAGSYNGNRVIYETEGLIKDENSYGTQKGDQRILKVADGKQLEALHPDKIFVGWSLEQDHSYDLLYPNQEISLSVLQKLIDEQGHLGCLYLYPIFEEAALMTFDVSESPVALPSLENETTIRYDSYYLPDISKYFENSGYIFVGWKNQYNEIYKQKQNEPIHVSDDYTWTLIAVKEKKVKITYDCSQASGLSCPVDSEVYSINDTVKLKSMKNTTTSNGRIFHNWMNEGDSVYSTLKPVDFLDLDKLSDDSDTLTITLTPELYKHDPDSIVLNMNAEDVEYNEQLISYGIPNALNDRIPQRKGYCITGWSTEPDNKGENAQFFDYGEDNYGKTVEPDENGVRQLYAQWVSIKDIAENKNFCKMNFIRDLGGDNMQITLYRRKGMFFNKYNFWTSLEAKESSFDDFFYISANYWKLTNKNGQDIELSRVPDVDEETYEIHFLGPHVEFISAQHGKLKSASGKLVNSIKILADNGNYFRRLKSIPEPVADEGYEFKGWRLLPYYKIKAPALREIKNFNDFNTFFKLKKDIWSTDELSELVIRNSDIINFLYDESYYYKILDNLTIIPIFEKREATSATVRYFYDGKEDAKQTEHIEKLYVGDKLEAYPDKCRDGYVLEKVEGVPLTVSRDEKQNEIKVYYVRKTTAATIRYYYDGEEDASASYTVHNLKIKEPYARYDEKKPKYYVFDKADTISALQEDAAENIIRVYYVRAKTSVRVEYYYDGILDEHAGYTVSAIKAGTVYKEYKDKGRMNYSLAYVSAPERMLEDPEENVIRVYYIRNKAVVRVQYYYDGQEDPDAEEILGTYHIADTVKGYPDKIKAGYYLERTENLPLKVSGTAEKDIIRIYYRKKHVENIEGSEQNQTEHKDADNSEIKKEKKEKRTESIILTGDTQNTQAWLVLLLLCGIGILILKRRQKD